MFELMTAARFDVPARTARGVARLSDHHPMFADHFPGAPVLPGSIAVELAAQLAGPLAELTATAEHDIERWAILQRVERARFVRPVYLPATLELAARIVRLRLRDGAPASVELAVAARVGGERVMSCEVAMWLIDAAEEHTEAIGARRARVDRWIAAWPAAARELA